MLSANPSAVRTGKVALVGSGHALKARAAVWNERGWSVDWLTPGVAAGPRNVLDVPAAEASEAVRQSLTGYDRVEFGSRGGRSFRAVQAKLAGLAFADTTLAVVRDDTAPLQRRRDGRLPVSLIELVEDHAERYVLEHADEVVGGRTSGPPRDGSWAQPPLVTVVVPFYNLGAFLPEALASLAGQTYPALEVIVIDDGSTDPASVATFDRMRHCHPSFRFERQRNQGIGATRNAGLKAGRGEYFLPFDADNVARPDMVERYVTAMRRRPEAAALTCYFHAFEDSDDIPRDRFLYACRPTGGPFVLAASQNVYGDACAIFRRRALLECGGFETDRDTSFEDWELFVKMAGRGMVVDVVPQVLFYYRHRASGFSRATDGFANHQRVLRQFAHAAGLPPHERELIGQALAGLERGREARGRGMASRMWGWLRGEG
jgi:glycosyltransferase involved in cell wall biosynthesis